MDAPHAAHGDVLTEPPTPGGPERRAWTPPTRWFLVLVALHSLVLGAAMLLVPALMARALGFAPPAESFWPSQSGIFLIVLGICYLLAVRRREMVATVLVSKGLAVPFLVIHALLGAPSMVWAAAGGDAGMLTVMLVLLRRERLLAERSAPAAPAAGIPDRRPAAVTN